MIFISPILIQSFLICVCLLFACLQADAQLSASASASFDWTKFVPSGFGNFGAQPSAASTTTATKTTIQANRTKTTAAALKTTTKVPAIYANPETLAGSATNNQESPSTPCGFGPVAVDPVLNVTVPAEPGQVAWQVSVMTKRMGTMWHHSCGGALITPQAVLTSASCVDG